MAMTESELEMIPHGQFSLAPDDALLSAQNALSDHGGVE
jgi:hypothetical protein